MALPATEKLFTIRRSSRLRQRLISSSRHVASTNASLSIKSTPTAGGILLKLPPEIRDMIYALLFSAGDLSLLRTCRGINTEAQSTFYRAGIFRQEAGYYAVNRLFDTSSQLLAQNFELRCNLDCYIHSTTIKPVLNFRPASYFVHRGIYRNKLLIKLNFGILISLSGIKSSITKVLKRRKSFVGFRVLVVELMPRLMIYADEGRIRLFVKKLLEPILGPAVEHNGDNGPYIKFRPWSAVGRQHHILEPVSITYDVLNRQRFYTRFHEVDRPADENEEEHGGGGEIGEGEEVSGEKMGVGTN